MPSTNPTSATVFVIGLLLDILAVFCVTGAHAAVITPIPRDVTVKLMRGSGALTADPRTGQPLAGVLTVENCPGIRDAIIDFDGLTRETGANVYKCVVEWRAMVTFKANSCPPLPAPQGRVTACPSGTTGAFTQTKSWAAAPHPVCAVEGEWTPAAPTPEQCPPIDTDNDGVPDSADECPTVYAVTPNGCPATPPTLPAPANINAQGISTSSIRVSWDDVPGAAAYSFERCIGGTCVSFSQLVCVQSPLATHSYLPAGLTARYRVRASRDAACSNAAGNLGEYSAVVSGTTFSQPTPVNCVVSAWSPWSAGAWSACAGGQQSRTETRTRTVTTQPANGGTSCPALSETRHVTQACSSPAIGTASLRWTPPTQNTDGTALTNLAGYRIHYGHSADELTQTIQVSSPAATSYSVTNLEAGTWFFGVRAYTSSGTESELSNIATRTVP